jgi:RimJ/RimL family protein N-acetyltransferase
LGVAILPIHGDDIVVDRLLPNDALALARSHSDADNARYQDWRYPLSEADAHRLIAEAATTEPFAVGDEVQLAIRDDPGGDLVGDLFLHRTATEPWVVWIGITLTPGAGGKGRAQRAVTAAVDAAFGAGDTADRIERVAGRLDAGNERSRRLFERLGFRREAHHHLGVRRRDGRLADELVFAVTADTWRQRSSDELVLESEPHPADIEFLDERIYEFNVSATGHDDGESLAILRRDELGRIEAGVFGWTWGQAAEVRTLWVRDGGRQRGVGSRLLDAFERAARQRGCRRMFVGTHSFQAPAFYERHGFRRTAEWRDYPRRFDQIFLEKDLNAQ